MSTNIKFSDDLIEADNTELLNDFKQSLKDAAEGKTFPLSELWEEE